MNNLLKSLMLFAVVFSISSCSVESIDEQIQADAPQLEAQTASAQTCSGNNPKSKLTNNGTAPLTFTVYSDNMNSVATQSNIQPGTSSGWISFIPGETMFSIKSNTTGVSDSKLEFSMDTCTEVDIVIGTDNSVESSDIVDSN